MGYKSDHYERPEHMETTGFAEHNQSDQKRNWQHGFAAYPPIDFPAAEQTENHQSDSHRVEDMAIGEGNDIL